MQEENGEHPFGDVGQLIFFGIYVVVWVGDSFFFRLSIFLSESIPLVLRLVVLALSLAAAFYLSMSGHVVVSHEQRPGYVVSTGAFRYIRHPLYLAVILFDFGLFFSTVSLISLALLLVIFVFYNYIATYEEKLLEGRFGEEYSKYMRRTGKWVPRFSKGSQEST